MMGYAGGCKFKIDTESMDGFRKETWLNSLVVCVASHVDATKLRNVYSAGNNMVVRDIQDSKMGI